MQNLGLVLLAFAFVFVSIEAYQSRAWAWIGVACWIAAELFGGILRAGFLH
jgi:hypothetical protein